MNEPNDRQPLGDETFRFACNTDVACFTRCCHDIRIELRPYDIIRLKKAIGGTTTALLDRHTHTVRGGNPNFPDVRLSMADAEGSPCPFLTEGGCEVYGDRPDACRTYPLERGISLVPLRPGTLTESYFLARQPVCRGHDEDREWTVKEWIRDQGIEEYNRMNDLWAELEIIFRAAEDCWGVEGMDGQSFRMAFMALYDVDRFRQFVLGSSFLKRYRVKPETVRRIKGSDEALLRFAHHWVKLFVFRVPTPLIVPRKT